MNEDNNVVVVKESTKEKIFRIGKIVGKVLLTVVTAGAAAYIGASIGAARSVDNMIDAVVVDSDENDSDDATKED